MPKRPPAPEPSAETASAPANTPLYPKTDKVKATFQIPATDLDLLKAMAEADGNTVTATLRRAIRTEQLLRELDTQGQLLLVGPDGQVKQLIRD